ncbi:MAG: tetratricopeptide (TPR) repeat protein [bacterium]|jgi:tetratricopeptide (TPR) repeat protein
MDAVRADQIRHRYSLLLFLIIINTFGIQISAFWFDKLWQILIFLIILPTVWLLFWKKINIFPEEHQSLLQFQIILGLVAGPFSILNYLVRITTSMEAHTLQEYRALLEDVDFSPDEQLNYDIKENYWKGDIPERLIEPFIDIMKEGNLIKKRSTIDKVVEHPGESSKEILNLGLHDQNPDVRFYAASGIIMLNDKFMKYFREKEEKLIKDPHNNNVMLELALLYEQYCDWHLPEKEDYQRYYQKILDLLKQIRRTQFYRQEALILLGKMYLKLDQAEDAEKILEEALTHYPDHPDIIPWHLESLLVQRKYRRIYELNQRYYKREIQLSYSAKDAIQYWKRVLK